MAGTTWELQFQAGDDPRFFYDCFDFWTTKRAITYADAIEGRFPVIRTTDGETWRDIGDRLRAARPVKRGSPPAAPVSPRMEASGHGSALAEPARRILATTDGGNSWTDVRRSRDHPGYAELRAL